MSITIPVTAQIARPKAYFYFHSPLRTIFSSPTVTDTTPVSTRSPARTTAKTYNLNIPSGANTIRVIIHGYVDGHTGYFILNIDGVDVATASTTSLSETTVLDYIGSISPGTRTIRIDYYNPVPEFSVYITRVYIATGIGLTSTTLTNLITFSVTYQLLRSGDIRYSPGIRVFVFGNRKTTAPLSLTIPEATNITVGRNNLGAGNDNDKAETILAILTGSVTFQEGGEFTIPATLRGNVGASGDIIIITRILARVQLRRESTGVGEVRVYERGVVEFAGRALVVSVPGGVTSTCIEVQRRELKDQRLASHCISGSGADVTVFNFRTAVVTPVHFTIGFCEDSLGEAFIEWVQVVVWG
jgi:hypothetical protein